MIYKCLKTICPDINIKSCGHDDSICIYGNYTLRCKDCLYILIDDIREIIVSLDPYRSCVIAKCFADETGNLLIPCKILLNNIPGIEPVELIVEYKVLFLVIHILGVLTTQFVDYEHPYFDKNSSLNRTFINSFLSQYMNVVNQISNDNSDVNVLLVTILKQMKDIVKDGINVIEYYFNILCPYVLLFHPINEREKRPIDPINLQSLCDLFVSLNATASQIRERYSKYSIQFDIMYVMIYCSLCMNNMDVLANFVIDFISRLCTGYFDSNHALIIKGKESLDTVITYKNNTELYYVKKEIAAGQCNELLSIELVDKIGKMNHLVTDTLKRKVPELKKLDHGVQMYAFSQTFPYILFPSDEEYYAFIASISMLINNMNKETSTLKKGTIVRAKMLFKLIKLYFSKFKEFLHNCEVPYIKLDMLELFLSTEKDMVENIKTFSMDMMNFMKD